MSRPLDIPRTTPSNPPETPRRLPDKYFSCHHKSYIFLGKVKQNEDVVAIEHFWKSQYDNDQALSAPPPLGLIGIKSFLKFFLSLPLS